MGIYKRKSEGTDVWYLRYWDTDGNLVRRSSGTKDRRKAEAMLAEAEAEVALQRRARFEQAVTGLGMGRAHRYAHGRARRMAGAYRPRAGAAPCGRIRDAAPMGKDRDRPLRPGLSPSREQVHVTKERATDDEAGQVRLEIVDHRCCALG